MLKKGSWGGSPPFWPGSGGRGPEGGVGLGVPGTWGGSWHRRSRVGVKVVVVVGLLLAWACSCFVHRNMAGPF